jgi:hypothetical protein
LVWPPLLFTILLDSTRIKNPLLWLCCLCEFIFMSGNDSTKVVPVILVPGLWFWFVPM